MQDEGGDSRSLSRCIQLLQSHCEGLIPTALTTGPRGRRWKPLLLPAQTTVRKQPPRGEDLAEQLCLRLAPTASWPEPHTERRNPKWYQNQHRWLQSQTQSSCNRAVKPCPATPSGRRLLQGRTPSLMEGQGTPQGQDEAMPPNPTALWASPPRALQHFKHILWLCKDIRVRVTFARSYLNLASDSAQPHAHSPPRRSKGRVSATTRNRSHLGTGEERSS